MQLKGNNRILWIDICKVLTICMVVIGHTTSQYNMYIYQFHMAAFFWLSGYCTNWSKSSKGELVWRRFCALILPLWTIFAMGAIGLFFLNNMGLYDFFYGKEYPYIGLKGIFSQYIMYGNNYVWWMGATWFISVLFLVIVLHACLLAFIRMDNKIGMGLYVVTIVLLYLWGINLAHSGHAHRNIDLVLIGQFYYGMGVASKKKEHKMANVKTLWLICVAVASAVIMYCLKNIPDITVDYPGRAFGHPIWSAWAAINGIVCVVSFSMLLAKLMRRMNILQQLVSLVSRNTIAIVFFHFLMFKVIYGILILCNVVDSNYMLNITPTPDGTGQKHLVVFLGIALVGSIILWKTMEKIPLLNYFMGAKKEYYAIAYERIGLKKIYEKICIFKNNAIDMGKQQLCHLKKLTIGEKVLAAALVILFILICIPIVSQGITLNDDLRYRLLRQNSFFSFLKEAIKNELRMGRPLRILGAVNLTMGFLFENTFANRIVQCLLLGLAVLLFAKFVQCLFRNTPITLVTITLVLGCLPLSFEHSAPNAFNGLVIIPMIWLFTSFIYWIKYLQEGTRKCFWIYVCCWIIALQGYEYIVTYTPAFIFIYIYINGFGRKQFSSMFKKCFAPGAIGCAYLIGTVVLQNIMESVYAGVTIAFESFDSSWQILKTLAVSSLPGYFLFNKKYVYLLYVYTGEITRNTLEAVTSGNIASAFINKECITEIVAFAVQHVFTVRNVMISACIVVLCYCLTKHRSFHLTRIKLLPVAFIGLYLFIPALPNSVGQLYQHNVNDNSFTNLPVSLFLFFTACLLLSYTICWAVSKSKRIVYLCGTIMLLLVLGIQTMNTVIAEENSKDFARVVEIEDVLDTTTIRNLQGASIYAPDFFETRNLLAIHGTYWDDVCKQKQIELRFSDEKEAEVKIFYVDDTYFCILTDSELAILSPSKLATNTKIQVDNEIYAVVNTNSWKKDGEYYCYSYIRDTNGFAEKTDSEYPFCDFERAVGTDLDTAVTIGIYDDGWCNQKIVININSGDDGVIEISGWFPAEISDKTDYTIDVYIDDKFAEVYEISSNTIYIPLILDNNTVYKIDLYCDYLMEIVNGDTRELSYIINDIK